MVVLGANGDINGRYIAETILTKYDDNVTGYDLNTSNLKKIWRIYNLLDQYVDMFEIGVVDSFNVVKTALDDACSVGICSKLS